ncbi:MAG: hypothetical protein K9M75_07485 [Phycisphaerae bacterium]|nr:hypothetical protein [Phycisphaerae bacterium]
MKPNKLSEKDKKTIKIGAVLMAIILVSGGMNILLSEYSKTSKELNAVKTKFNSVMPNSDGSLTLKQAGLFNIVPVFETPTKEDIPGAKFREKFMEQLKKAKVNFKDLNLLPMSNKTNECGFRKRNLHCQGKCTFAQAMDLLASLYENPWFVGIEEFKIECDPKNRSQMDLTITVSTFIK